MILVIVYYRFFWQPTIALNCFDAPSEKLFLTRKMLLAKVEEQAKIKDCCKVTLEVLEGNEAARNSYLKFGFDGYELNPKMGKALFWQKLI